MSQLEEYSQVLFLWWEKGSGGGFIVLCRIVGRGSCTHHPVVTEPLARGLFASGPFFVPLSAGLRSFVSQFPSASQGGLLGSQKSPSALPELGYPTTVGRYRLLLTSTGMKTVYLLMTLQALLVCTAFA